MSSFQEDFYLDTSSPLRRFVRNLRLLGYMVQMTWTWAVTGGRVRRRLRKAKRTGEPFVIDALDR